MKELNPTADDIFAEAALIENVRRRQEFVRETCGDDHQLLQQVESLLCAHHEAASFLEDPILRREANDKTEDIFRETCGSVIGPYKLLQRIGEGGFGVVYMAEQKTPVRRKVAIKLIKPGMDTREVIARFEAERQALAMMDHPNIAKVYDAGASERGQPYFVMELVRGVSITEFCDANKLSVRERLDLFATVCKAVQHAHQKGIIHRDLKPSNVMVTTCDGELMTKVIDFGVAKAINQELTEKTLFTAYGQMVGTPHYMSPEQAQISAMDVDTRSDVYALGALLYELLTGTTPLDAQRLRSSGFEEMRRIIREEDPPVPSVRLSTMEQQLATVAANRGAEAPDLSGAVRGELDWIVMKALDKDRRRRYQSASDFAADVENYLSGENVEAVAPTVGYRVRKFVRRNRVPLAMGTAVFFSLILGLIGTSWMAIEANRQQRLAFAALDRVQDELRWRSFMLALSGQREELEDVLEDVDKSMTPNKGWAERVRGIAAHESGDSSAAITHLKQAIELGDETMAAYVPIVSAYWALNDNPGARPYASAIKDLLASNDERTLEEDFFVATWTCWDEPQRAYEIANRVFARYPSPAVLRVRSYICRSFGNHTGEVKWFEQAIADGHAQWRAAGKDGAPEFPMWCHASAIDTAKANGDQKTVDYHTLVGQRLAAKLKRRPDYGAAYTAAASAVFYEAIGDLESAEEAHRIGAESNDNGKRKYAAFLVTHCHDEQAMAVIDRMGSPFSYNTADICRVAVLAESPATRPQVRELILERVAKADDIQWIGFLYQFGFPVEAKREAVRIVKKLRGNGGEVPPALEFFAYLMDEDQLEASAENERLLLADARFRIIQRQLGEGNRKTAKECLQKWPPILRERAHDDLLLTRMRNLWERDPNWPHWIPVEAATEQN